MKRFDERNLRHMRAFYAGFPMRQLYETYRDDKKVAPLVRQLPWTHHLIIMGQCNRSEEREFYLRMAIGERWGKRELERQFRAALSERVVFSPPKVSPLVRQMHPSAEAVFKDAYEEAAFNLAALPVTPCDLIHVPIASCPP